MSSICTVVWTNEAGRYLVVRERTSHTGHHQDIRFTDQLEQATIGYLLPNAARKMQLTPVHVRLTRYLEIM